MRNKILLKILALFVLIGLMLGSVFGGLPDVAYAAKFNMGDTVEVYNTGTSGLLVLDAPCGNVIGGKFDGDRGMVLDGHVYCYGYNRWKIRWDDGLEGWSAEDWLKEIYIPPSTKFSIGDTVRVYNTGSSGLSVRTDPPELAYITEVDDDTEGTIDDGPFYGVPKGKSGFYHFWKVDYGNTVGWCWEDYLEKVVNQPPTCSLSANPKSGNAPLTVTFTMSASDPDGWISGWVLDVDGDGNADYSGTGSPPSTQQHTYTTSGSYGVMLVVSDNDGATDFDTETVIVGENEPPTCSLSATPKSGKAPLTVTFSMSASDPDGWISAWVLDVDSDGNVDYSGSGNPPSTQQHTYQNEGSYTAILMVSDNEDATDSDAETMNVNLPNQPPTCSLSANPKSGNAPLTVTFTMSASDPDGWISGWVLDVDGDGNADYSGTGNPPSTQQHTYTTSGSYSVMLVVSDNDGATDFDTETVIVGSPNQPPECSLSASPKSGKAPLTVTFSMSASDSDGSISSWALRPGDGSPDYFGSGNPPSTQQHTYQNQGSYTPILMVSDNDDATDSDSETITVNPPNQLPTCSLTANPKSGNAPLTVTFTMSASDSDGWISIWVLDVDGDGNADYSGSGNPPSTQQHTYTTSSSYSVMLVVSDNDGATASDTETVIVGENALPTVETGGATDITETAATLNGVITDDGGASIDERRFDWGTTSSCSDGWTNSVTVSGNSFSYRLTGLEQGKTYYFRAWAHNSVGWGKGTVLPFTTTTPANVALTLYVHEGSASGPVLAGVRVTGQDGAGNSFDKTTGSSGYVTITGVPGSWQFTASKTGYQTNSWAQCITTACEKHAFLIKEDGDLGARAANLAEQVAGAPYLWGGKGWNWNPAGGWKWENGKFIDPDSIRNGYYYYSSSTGQVEFGKGVDCSGLVFWAYNKAGEATKYKDPSNPIYEEGASGQWKNDVEQISNEIPAVGDLETGDLLFLDTNENGLADHVGMYAGDGYVIHSVGAEGVVKETLGDWLNRAVASTGKKYKDYFVGYGRVKTSSEVPKPLITSPLEITQKDTYYVGDTLTAEFTIANKGTGSITFDVLVVGGRDPNGEVVDFEKAYDITLNPGDSYNYQGSLTLPDKPGIYHFFCAYHTADYLPGEDENNWNTNIDVEIDGKIVEDLSEAKRYRERNIIVFESATPVPPSASWEEIQGPWEDKWAEPSQIAVHPDNPKVLYTVVRHSHDYWGYGSEGDELYKSINNGGSWSPINHGLPHLNWPAKYYWPIGAIAIAPSNPDVIYVGTSDFNPYSSLIPSAKGIYKSTNGGLEWTSVGRPYTGGIFKTYFPISSIVVNPSDPNTVYVGTVGGGIWKTTNGGEPWKQIWYEPVPGKNLDVSALAISSANPNVIYAATYHFPPQNLYGAGLAWEYDIIKSENGGDTFETLPHPEKTEIILYKIDGIAVDNKNADIVYVMNENYKVYKSITGGRNWLEANGVDGDNPLPFVQPVPGVMSHSYGGTGSIAIHPDYSNTIFASGEWGFKYVYFSPDSGENWFPLGDLKDKHIKGIVLTSDADSCIIYATAIQGLFKTDISNNPPNKPPIAKFIYSPPEPFVKLFVNQTITFDASSSYDSDGFITNYKWDFGDGNITNTTEEIVTHLYSPAGNYAVNLTVTDDDGANNSASEILEVREAKPTVSISTKKNEYHSWDVMMITIGLVNPTESTQQVLFKWDLILPDYDYWINITSTEITLSPMSVEYFLMPLHIVNWPSVEFNAIWYVAFYNTTTLEFISKDTADWKYVPSKMAEGETIPDVEEIASEITKEFEEIELPGREV